MATYTTLAIVDDVNACDCCGKQNLKSTVAMERDDGEVVYFGSVCATRHSGREAKAIRSEAKHAHESNVKNATVHYRHSYEAIEYSIKLAEASRLGIRPGKAFADHVRNAGEAADAKRKELAEQFRVAAYEIN